MDTDKDQKYLEMRLNAAYENLRRAVTNFNIDDHTLAAMASLAPTDAELRALGVSDAQARAGRVTIDGTGRAAAERPRSAFADDDDDDDDDESEADAQAGGMV